MAPKRIVLVFTFAQRQAINVARTPPLGIAYIAAFLEEQGHQVSIIDQQVDDDADLLSRIEGADILGVSALTPYIAQAYDLIREAKRRNPRLVTVLGGPHASALAEECLRDLPELDAACVGEGEEVMTEIAAGQPFSSIKGILFRGENGEIRKNCARTADREIDTYPYPAFHLFPLAKYSSSQPMLMSPFAREAVITTARGCPFACNFCFKGVFGRKVRYRSAESVVKEIRFLKERYGYTHFAVLDDLFNVHMGRAKEICRQLIAEKLDIRLVFPNGIRADLFDEELARLLSEAGAQIVAFGVETGDQTIMNQIGKRLDLSLPGEAVRLSRKYGILTNIFMILGHKWDTPATVRKTIDAALKMDSDYCQFTVATPIPGSAFFTEAKANGELLVKSYSDYDHYSGKQIYRHPNLSAEELAGFLQEANRRFYWRVATVLRLWRNPWIVWNLLKHSRRALSLFRAQANSGNPPSGSMSTAPRMG